jgi:sugar O-acyltransferase (sialic acid O-acetyltransferase NeuD family)
MSHQVWIVGSGGHAKVVIDALQEAGADEIMGILDDDPRTIGSTVLGVPVVGAADRETVARLAVSSAVIAIGNNRVRAGIAARLAGLVSWRSVIHPRVVVSRFATIDPGAMVCAGAVVQADAVIGAHVIVNTCASVDHDTRVGVFAHVAPGARLAGGCTVGNGALLGVNAATIPGIAIGEWATVGAGATVIEPVPDGQTVVGTPARVLDISRA